MPTYVQGTRATTDLVSQNRKYSLDAKLWRLDPEAAKVAFFARKLNKKSVSDPEFSWFEKEQPSRYDAVNGAIADGTTTSIVVDDGTKFRAGDVVQVVSTGEQMLVTAVSGNTLTVTRGWGDTAGAAIADNAVVVIIGNAHAEGATTRDALTTKPERKYNYTQIFREPFDVTETNAATELFVGGNDINNLRLEHLEVHLKDIERSFLFGEPKEDTSGAKPRRATGGLNYWINTHVTSVSGGTLTESEWDSFVREVFSTGGDKKMAFMSPLIASAVESWAKTKLNLYPKDKTYGIAIRNYISIHGSIDFVVEKLLAENSTWAGMAFFVDLERIGYRYLSANGKNRDTRLLKDRQANDEDSIREEYLSEIGFWLANENRHGVLKGVTDYS